VQQGLRSGELISGRLSVPSFQTDVANVITETESGPLSVPVTGFMGRNRAMHGDTVAAIPLWKAWKGKDSKVTKASSEPTKADGLAELRAVVLECLQKNEGRMPLSVLGQNSEVKAVRKSLGLKKALCMLDGFEVVIEGSPPEDVVRGPPIEEEEDTQRAPLDQARCRVVAVLKRVGGEIVTLLSGGEEPLKLQPRDRRLPSFWVSSEPHKSAQTDAVQAHMSTDQLKVAREKVEGELLCVATFSDWPRESLSPRARVLEVLGPQGSMQAESDALLAFHQLEWRPFPDAVEKELRALFPSSAKVVEDALVGGRSDLRHLRCISIDPPQAKDLDDAVSVEPSSKGTFRIGVHIANVAHFVVPGSHVDSEARRRATTVYLPNRVYPMLPRWLSENLCSLLPHVDRLAMSVFFTLESDGTLQEDSAEFCLSVIQTREKLDYNTVDDVLSGRPVEGLDEGVLSDLRILAELTSSRKELLQKGGKLSLERSQLSLRLDGAGRVTEFVQERSSISHSLIEELMVLANHLVAKRLVDFAACAGQDVSDAPLPPLLRRHQSTEADVRRRLFELLGELGSEVPDGLSVSELFSWCREHLSIETFEAVCADALCAFKEASYVVSGDDEVDGNQDDNRHWALNLSHYMHFTSPIRRYADVLVHRRLAHILHEEAVPDNHSFMTELRDSFKVCNVKKRAAQDAQTEARQNAFGRHVRQSGGLDVHDAVITRVILPKNETETEVTSPKKSKRVREPVYKAALEFYVPMAQATRSVSLETLNIEFVAEPEQRSVRVKVIGSEHEVALEIMAPVSVRLVSTDGENEKVGSNLWTIRFPWALDTNGRSPVADAVG